MDPVTRTAVETPAASPVGGSVPVRSVRILSLATATRDYARSVESCTFDRLGSSDIARLCEAMGVDLWAWQYARRLTRQSPWRARSDVEEGVERAIAARAMADGIETWARALTALDEQIEQARVNGWALPEPLAIPSEIRDALEARNAAALERIARKRGRAGGGDTDPAAAIHHPPYPGRPV